MSQSSSPGTPGILPGTDDPVFVSSPEDGFGAEPPPAPPAHAAEDGVDTPFASWSMSIPLTSTPPVPPPPAWAGPSDTDSERSSTEAEDPPPHPRPALPLRPSALMVSIPHFGPMGRRRPPASVVA